MSSAWLWRRLEDDLGRRVAQFPGVAGLCVKDLRTGHTIAIRGDEEFPTASTIKIHVLTQLLLRAELGEVDLSRMITLTPEMQVPGSGVLTYLDGPVTLSLLNVAILMIIVSDNTATNVCIDLADIDATNALLRRLGLTRTSLRRKMQDRAAIARNDENTATPVECVGMLELLYTGKPTPTVAAQALTILKKPKRGPFNLAIPATIPLANKAGGMERVRCDAGIVYLPRRPYAMAVMTKFGLQEPEDQERFVTDAARSIQDTMVALDTSSDFGQGIVS
jgi:beta-lactamase class A